MSALAWIVLTSVLVAVACALSGSLLQLRRQPLMGDALSHAVLPGIAVAFLLSGTRATWAMLPGAAAFALLMVWLTERIRSRGRLREDASMGIVFTTLFAIGVILISAYAGYIDLDQDCVLYGELVYAPWHRWSLGGIDLGPRSVGMLLMAIIANLALLAALRKELVLGSFDPNFAKAIGLPDQAVHYALMTVVALTTVAAFESVGAILVVAFLIVPSATARLISKSVSGMLAASVLFGAASSLVGLVLAAWFDTSLAGSMAVGSGLLFLITGTWSKWASS